jgi:hypothetical protein
VKHRIRRYRNRVASQRKQCWLRLLLQHFQGLGIHILWGLLPSSRCDDHRRGCIDSARRADEVLPDAWPRHRVISFEFSLRFLFVAHPQAIGKVSGIVCRAIFALPVHFMEIIALPEEHFPLNALLFVQFRPTPGSHQ